ncbi:MGH1-like glycoside hydrolase domain-containing protein [Microbacterium sp. NPDC055903]
MSPRDAALRRLRTEAEAPVASASAFAEDVRRSGVGFAAIGGPLEDRWRAAFADVDACVRPIDGSPPVLNEGGAYDGCWLESTGTINTDVLGRFAPTIAADTLRLFARHQRDDGMLPYKVTPDGPGFSQIQIVTPLARVVWRQHLRDQDAGLLAELYEPMVRYDAWLARFRDTGGTGAVEAFCAFDTGHDLSPRFWFAPDRAHRSDARLCDPDSATMPYIAPDLTANVVAQRRHLAVIAQELGGDGDAWHAAADDSERALYAQCFDAEDGLFYDRDRAGRPVRIASDVLLRVLACDIGDEEFFMASLRRYLMNTRKFLAHYGFTSVAMDDPRFDADATRNSWGGPVNFLALLRAPDAFEPRGHVAELALASTPVLQALATADRFPQCLDPWSGEAGYTSCYSPSALWLIDAIERFSGILPDAEGGLWFSGLAPTRLDHGAAADAVAYARVHRDVIWELAADDDRVEVHRQGVLHLAFPRGWRVETDDDGNPLAVVGLSAGVVVGELRIGEDAIDLTVAPNERVVLEGLRTVEHRRTEFVAPVL